LLLYTGGKMDNSSNSIDATTAGIVGGLVLVYCVVLVVVIAVGIWLYWRIFAKAGFNGALAFLNLIPGIGPLICILILAFGKWPIEEHMAALQSGRPVGGSSFPPPGTSVTPS
jgi:uncharacterized membrane protein YhaH (DUF805 family)